MNRDRSGQQGQPLLLEFPDRVWAAVAEADLTDHAGLYLKADAAAPGVLEARLSPVPRDAPKPPRYTAGT